MEIKDLKTEFIAYISNEMEKATTRKNDTLYQMSVDEVFCFIEFNSDFSVLLFEESDEIFAELSFSPAAVNVEYYRYTNGFYEQCMEVFREFLQTLPQYTIVETEAILHRDYFYIVLSQELKKKRTKHKKRVKRMKRDLKREFEEFMRLEYERVKEVIREERERMMEGRDLNQLNDELIIIEVFQFLQTNNLEIHYYGNVVKQMIIELILNTERMDNLFYDQIAYAFRVFLMKESIFADYRKNLMIKEFG
jgi:hypothetical protein